MFPTLLSTRMRQSYGCASIRLFIVKPERLLADAGAEIALKHGRALGGYEYHAELKESSLLLTRF